MAASGSLRDALRKRKLGHPTWQLPKLQVMTLTGSLPGPLAHTRSQALMLRAVLVQSGLKYAQQRKSEKKCSVVEETLQPPPFPPTCDQPDLTGSSTSRFHETEGACNPFVRMRKLRLSKHHSANKQQSRDLPEPQAAWPQPWSFLWEILQNRF